MAAEYEELSRSLAKGGKDTAAKEKALAAAARASLKAATTAEELQQKIVSGALQCSAAAVHCTEMAASQSNRAQHTL